MPRDIIGSPVHRADAWAKLTGQACYVADLDVPGAWWGGTLRSPVARGRIRAIARDPQFDWSRVVLMTAADLPGPNEVAMIHNDHPILAADEVRFVSQAVALVAAPDRRTLTRALAALALEIDERPPVLTLDDALAARCPVWGTDNVMAEYRIARGDLTAGMQAADLVIEGTYRTGHQEHAYLEPNGMIAHPRGEGGIAVRGSMQCPYYVHNALAHGLGLDPAVVAVGQLETGGAFGGKEDYPSVLALHAALLALRCGHPVKMIYERREDMCATTKRHPARVRHRTGVMRDGRLTAIEIDLLLDGGAFATMSPVVLSRAVLHAAGAYRTPHAVIRGRALATNTPPNGAFRGFGAPQALFAAERQMDRVARTLALEPLDLRRCNLLAAGDHFPFGQELGEDVGASLVLERAVELSGYEERRAASAAGHGIGLSLYFHGGGFTGSGEERISGEVAVEFLPGDDGQGRLDILVSNVEMGQGAATVLPMIAAQALGLPYERVHHPHPDTTRVPDSGPTVASRTTMIIGRILIAACNDLVANLSRGAAARSSVERGTFRELALRHIARGGSLRGTARYAPPPGDAWDEKAYRGNAYKAYSWGADVVEVAVDPDTLEVRPIKVTVVVEIGRAIHPVLAMGQVIGGTLQALGWGYLEEIKMEGGRYLNDSLATYIIPTFRDAPEMVTEIAELPYVHGPFGAKGLGELPLDGGAPALAAAIEHATGLVVDEIPITPERLQRAAAGRAR